MNDEDVDGERARDGNRRSCSLEKRRKLVENHRVTMNSIFYELDTRIEKSKLNTHFIVKLMNRLHCILSNS